MVKNILYFSGKSNRIVLDGESLTTATAVRLGQPDSQILLSERAKEKINASREVVETIIRKDAPIYGINTGFGVNSTVPIPAGKLEELQSNLVLSHATGTGNPLPLEQARTMVALRVNTLVRGHSGIRIETIQRMIDLFNKGLTPEVPTFGSVGASGDLAPLARIAAAYFRGKGNLWDPKQQQYRPAGDVLQDYGFTREYPLAAKEGLALINGTQYIVALGSHACQQAEQAFYAAQVAMALSLVAIEGHRDAFAPIVYQARPQPGMKEVADTVYRLTEGIRTTKVDPQDAYSFRCVPQVHGTAKHCLDLAKIWLDTELNSSTDNPLVSVEDKHVYSAGNFHGQPVATALDTLSIGVKHLINTSEQRIERLMEGRRHLPTFLVNSAGLNSGLMTKEIEAKAHAAEAVIPYSTMSRSTGVGKEDHVSMGPHSARQALSLVHDHLVPILATELAAATQAIRLRQEADPQFPVPAMLQPIFREMDKRFPHLEKDRYMAEELKGVEEFVRTTNLFRLTVERTQEGMRARL